MPTIAQVQEHLSSLTRDIEKGQQKYLPDTACLRLQHFRAIPSDQICIAISLAVAWARCSDVYSAVTFNSRHRVLFMLENASAAAEKLQRHLIVPEGQTYYTSGLEGIELCATQLIWAALIPWFCGFPWVSYSHSTRISRKIELLAAKVERAERFSETRGRPTYASLGLTSPSEATLKDV